MTNTFLALEPTAPCHACGLRVDFLHGHNRLGWSWRRCPVCDDVTPDPVKAARVIAAMVDAACAPDDDDEPQPRYQGGPYFVTDADRPARRRR